MISEHWGLFDQNIGLSQVREHTRMICFAAKWYKKRSTMFYSEFHHGRKEMLESAHSLMSEADIVMGYNGDKFDLRHLNREFWLAGMPPPAPSQTIDPFKVVKKQFLFASNKLDHILSAVGLEGKVKHQGAILWRRCLEGDPKAWNLMRRYNKRDVVGLEELYEKLLPWIPNHPNMGLINGQPDGCTNCGGTNLIRQGYAYTKLSRYQRYQCIDCGKWLGSTKREEGALLRSV